ncbi:MAG: hypothetical protein M1816_004619 [Peltula sp. TS41687]|nr:MAG: hypothetical protein M1816_004619 [Peltula sp. TS41687]
MVSPALHSAAHLSPSLALRASQQAPALLKRPGTSASSLRLPLSLFSTSESAEQWSAYERLFLSCIQTGDDESARVCLKRLTDRFGASNERIQGLRGMYEEAVAEDEAALERILKGYESTLAEDPTNMAIAKRRVALLRSLSRPVEAITALVALLDTSPTDAEAWAELSDVYQSQGLGQQAIFCLEEVLLITPNAWNIHARMGELVYLSTNPNNSSGGNNQIVTPLIDSMRWFCRSIELCDDYLRGYYGLKLVTDRLVSMGSRALEGSPGSRGSEPLGPQLPSFSEVERLNEAATAKLAEIIRRHSIDEGHGGAYDEAEVKAARELLDKHASKVLR